MVAVGGGIDKEQGKEFVYGPCRCESWFLYDRYVCRSRKKEKIVGLGQE